MHNLELRLLFGSSPRIPLVCILPSEHFLFVFVYLLQGRMHIQLYLQVFIFANNLNENAKWCIYSIRCYHLIKRNYKNKTGFVHNALRNNTANTQQIQTIERIIKFAVSRSSLQNQDGVGGTNTQTILMPFLVRRKK